MLGETYFLNTCLYMLVNVSDKYVQRLLFPYNQMQELFSSFL